MQKTNPEILQIPVPLGNTITIDPRNDVKPFTDVRVRQALQQAIDLPTIAKTYYNGTCLPYPSALTTNYMTGWGFPYSQWTQDMKDQYAYNPTAAKQLLAAAGYPNGFNTDCVAVNTADLDLLQIIKSYFAAIGVNMDIRTLDLASFVSFVITNHKHDALAVRQPGAGSLGLGYYPLRQFSKFTTPSGNIAMINDPVYNAFYTTALAATTTDALKSIVVDINKYVIQQHFVISLLQPMQYSFCQPWLKGYNAQYGSTYGPSGPTILYFYGGRMFLDQKLKTSLGH